MVKHTQIIRRQQPTYCSSVFGHFVGLALTELNESKFLPAPGIMANLVSGNPTFAVVEAILKSQARASSIPPPNAAPSIAQIVGTGTSLNR